MHASDIQCLLNDRWLFIKEAQQMKDVEKLESYIEHPLGSTIFIVGHKEKKIDGRSKLAKLIETKNSTALYQKAV